MSAPGATDPTAADARARRVARAFDRVMWLRVEDGGSSGVVAGTRHRRPVQLRVDGDVAVALADAGVPTVGLPGRGTA